MTLTDRAGPARIVASTTATESSPVHAAGSAAVVIGLLAGAMYLQGTFYPVDAFGITVLALGLVAAGVVWNRDRHGLAVTLATGGLAAWWFVRSIGVRSPATFLPFGASVLAFLAGFLVLRALGRTAIGRGPLWRSPRWERSWPHPGWSAYWGGGPTWPDRSTGRGTPHPR